MALLFNLPRTTQFDAVGELMSGWTVEFYSTGTSTPRTVWADEALTVELGTYVAAGDDGSLKPIYLDDSGVAYKVLVKDANGVIVPNGTIDPYIVSATQAQVGRALYPRSQPEISAGVTPTNYYEEYGNLERYGAVGNGTADDTTAWQNACKIGGYIRGRQGKTYRITGSGYVSTSDTTIDMRGCRINQVTAATPWLIVGRTAASSTFVKTDRVKILGGRYTGAVTGGGSPGYGITVVDPSDNPYVKGNGCNDIEIAGITSSGFTGGVAATAASNVRVHDCDFGGMLYHVLLGAGGYGVLFQTCFDVNVYSNRFLATSTDRHGVYISTNGNRTANDDNTCKGVVISNNIFDWTGTSGTTGFEAPIEIRSSQRTVVSGNSIRGGYGGIEFDAANGNGSAVIIGNEIKDTVAGASSRSAIIVYRDSGSNLNRDMVIANNSIEFNNSNVNGITVGYCLGAVVTGNSLKIGSALDAIIFDTSTNIRVANNNINVTVTASSGVNFAGSCTDVTIGANTYDGTITKNIRYTANPTSLKVDVPRSASVSWSGGTGTISDPDDIVASVASSANGFTVTFEAWVTDLAPTNVLLTIGSSNVCTAYWRSLASQTLTIGVKDFAGTDLPAASNNYDIAITLKS